MIFDARTPTRRPRRHGGGWGVRIQHQGPHRSRCFRRGVQRAAQTGKERRERSTSVGFGAWGVCATGTATPAVLVVVREGF